MATLMQMRRSVRSRLGVPATDSFLNDEVLDEHINLAVLTLEQEHRWPWNEVIETPTIDTATSTTTVPTNWRATRDVICENRQLKLITPGELYTEWATTDQGNPIAFCVVNRTIHYRPYVDQAYTVQHVYYKGTTLLTDDTDVPEMPLEYSPAIIAKASELLSLREDERGNAAAHAAEYLQWVQRMKKDVRRTTGPTTPRIRPGSWI